MEKQTNLANGLSPRARQNGVFHIAPRQMLNNKMVTCTNTLKKILLKKHHTLGKKHREKNSAPEYPDSITIPVAELN